MDVNAGPRTLWGMQYLASSPSAVVVHQLDLVYWPCSLRVCVCMCYDKWYILTVTCAQLYAHCRGKLS